MFAGQAPVAPVAPPPLQILPPLQSMGEAALADALDNVVDDIKSIGANYVFMAQLATVEEVEFMNSACGNLVEMLRDVSPFSGNIEDYFN